MGRHQAEQWLTYLMIVIFGIFTITLFFIHYPPAETRVAEAEAAELEAAAARHE